jgi:hypothetical protein
MVPENDNAERRQGGCSSSDFCTQTACLIIRTSFPTASLEETCQIIRLGDASHTNLLKIKVDQ